MTDLQTKQYGFAHQLHIFGYMPLYFLQFNSVTQLGFILQM